MNLWFTQNSNMVRQRKAHGVELVQHATGFDNGELSPVKEANNNVTLIKFRVRRSHNLAHTISINSLCKSPQSSNSVIDI